MSYEKITKLFDPVTGVDFTTFTKEQQVKVDQFKHMQQFQDLKEICKEAYLEVIFSCAVPDEGNDNSQQQALGAAAAFRAMIKLLEDSEIK